MDVVSENVRESNHATTAVTDSSTEGITTTDIRKRQRRIDAYVTAKEKVEELSEKIATFGLRNTRSLTKKLMH